MSHQAGLLTAVDRWLTGTVGGFAMPRFLRADVEADAWHRQLVRCQFRTRNDERGNGTDGHRYARRALAGYRRFRELLAAR